jgi:steroid delta-isomerase-like uncharacterized protein
MVDNHNVAVTGQAEICTGKDYKRGDGQCDASRHHAGKSRAPPQPEINLVLSPGGITTMSAIEVAQNNFKSWNRHDADAINTAYAEGDTYRTPRMGQALTGSAIGEYAKSVWKAFPDASLELISIGDTGGGLVAIQWMLHGTHTGPLMDGTPPSGRKVSYSGASFVQVEGDKIRSEQVYV